MVLDTSAIASILLGEPGHEDLVAVLAAADDPMLSAASLVEASIVMLAKSGANGLDDLDALLAAAGVRIVAVDAAQALEARTAYERFGKGRSPARLNFGDCFPYALAKALGAPLLFTGDDFARTDITPAHP